MLRRTAAPLDAKARSGGKTRLTGSSRRRTAVRHARATDRICPILRTDVTYYLFAPQGSGEAESLTPLKRRTTPHLTDAH
jgi:hypothetical protein